MKETLGWSVEVGGDTLSWLRAHGCFWDLQVHLRWAHWGLQLFNLEAMVTGVTVGPLSLVFINPDKLDGGVMRRLAVALDKAEE